MAGRPALVKLLVANMSCLRELVRWLNLVASWGVSPCYFAYLVAFAAERCNVSVDEVVEELLYDGWKLVVEARMKECFGAHSTTSGYSKRRRRRRKSYSSLPRRSSLQFCEGDDDTGVFEGLTGFPGHRLYHVIRWYNLLRG